MRIIEQFTQGKTGDDSVNEDNIVITPDFVVVLDGATSFSGHRIKGMANGRFASQTVGSFIKNIPADADAKTAVTYLSEQFQRALEKEVKAEGIVFDKPDSLPATTLLVYSRARKEIWRIGDSPFSVDGVESQKALPQIDLWVKTRQMTLRAYALNGVTETEMIENDPFTAALRILVPAPQAYINSNDPDWAFSMITGQKVPEKLIEVTPVANAQEIVLASDGYPKLFNTLAQTERHLQETLDADPLMLRIHPQVKGRKPGAKSFDDRAYVRFTP